MRTVLDASALLTGLDFEGELFTSGHILREVERHGLDPRTEALVGTKVRVVEPSSLVIARVRDKALETGDIARLSEPDIQIIALALELDAQLVTDDYSIQNMAEALGVKYRGAGLRPIQEKREWYYRCTGCGRYWEDPLKTCRVCGSPVKTTRRSPRGRSAKPRG